MPPIHIVIAVSDQTLRQCLVSLLGAGPEFEVVGAVDDSVKAVEKVRLLQPDVVLLDRCMPWVDGSLTLVAIRRECSEPRALVMARFRTDGQALMEREPGPRDRMARDDLREQLFAAIRNLDCGQPC